MVNPEKIEGYLANLESHTEKLRILAAYDKDDFLEDFKKTESAKHLLQVSIECCLNVSNHIIASEKYRKPGSYAESFEILAEEGILPDNFLPTLRQMAQFRNRLVHLYWDIETEVVYDILQKNLGDFDRFVKHVLAFMIPKDNEDDSRMGEK